MHNAPLIFWYRNNLRLMDNPALIKAIESGQPIIPVYILDDVWFDTLTELGFYRTSPKRKQFLAETLLDLKNALEKVGNTLHIFKGDSIEILTSLYNTAKANKIITQREFAWEEIETEQTLSKQLNLQLHWGSMLYQPNEVNFPTEKSPFYFTKFKNKVINQPFVPTAEKSPTQIPAPDNLKIPKNLNRFNPTDLIFEATKKPFSGGETNGLHKMNEYINSGGALHYAETRNFFQGNNFSSCSGSWLANGALSPRVLLTELKNEEHHHPEKTESIHPLIEQLIWRDNFRFLFLRYSKKFFTTHGLRKSEPTMYNDIEAFKQWQKGETGQPLIDALMHELIETGFMSNRGRMLTSFYLTKEMKVNWQWGAAWFESVLIDYDVCSNYGNWAYQSGRGTDSRVNRKFNIETQAKKFDPKGEYVKKWL
jgi:deoxyribodipyrimidine photo-lyase